jgi:hypothetical protein
MSGNTFFLFSLVSSCPEIFHQVGCIQRRPIVNAELHDCSRFYLDRTVEIIETKLQIWTKLLQLFVTTLLTLSDMLQGCSNKFNTVMIQQYCYNVASSTF